MGQHAKHRPLVGAALALTLLAGGTAAEAECRQALALGLDVSGSVDAGEYRLQLAGLADALDSPEVASVLLATPEVPVRIAVYEWSGSAYQRLILPWTAIDEPDALAAAVGVLRAHQREQAPPTTGIGAALTYGARLLGEAADCTKRTLDLSGDGQNNDWPRPEDVAADPTLYGVTVNALAVGSPTAGGGNGAGLSDLVPYFRARVIRGPGAFVEVAAGYGDYATAIKRKLLREIASLAIGFLD